MKVCLFALTGFGNTVLEGLVKSSLVTDVIVVTRKEEGRFPHYECEDLIEVCEKKSIKIFAYKNSQHASLCKIIKGFSPDMILVATFHRKISGDIIGIPRLGTINMHPSLLPRYRGPTPTNWTIINGEKRTGITFHIVKDSFDTGDILFQEAMAIDNLTDGELRKRLAVLSGNSIGDFLSRYADGRLKKHSQDISEAEYYPRITSAEAIAMLKKGKYDAENVRRGLTPYPGLAILD